MNDDQPRGVAAGREMAKASRLPSRAEVKGGKVALGRALFQARRDRKATQDLLDEEGTDLGGDAA